VYLFMENLRGKHTLCDYGRPAVRRRRKCVRWMYTHNKSLKSELDCIQIAHDDGAWNIFTNIKGLKGLLCTAVCKSRRVYFVWD
jgi:hypothetical protein